MKHTHAFLLVAGALMGNCAFIAKAGYPDLWVHEAAASNLILEIATDTNRYTPRDPVILFISLKNAGTRPISTTMVFPLEHLTFDLKDDKGESVPMTRWSTQILKRMEEQRFSIGGGELAPNAEEKFAIRLNAAFDLSRPGRYALQVSRALIAGGERTFHQSTNRLRSNVVSFEMDTGWEQIEWSEQANFTEKKLQPPYLLPKHNEQKRYR